MQIFLKREWFVSCVKLLNESSRNLGCPIYGRAGWPISWPAFSSPNKIEGKGLKSASNLKAHEFESRV